MNLTLRLLSHKLKFFWGGERWSAFETVRISESPATTQQPRGGNTPRNFSLRNSRATDPLAHQPPTTTSSIRASSLTGVCSRSRERRLLNHDWSGNPFQKIGGIKQKWNTKKEALIFVFARRTRCREKLCVA